MYELHQNEQYFFRASTVQALADFLSRYAHPCCLCAPMVGRRLAESGCRVTVLDTDTRFANMAGFRRYDLYRPEWLAERFDLILCDPPFFRVALSDLFRAVRQLSHNDFRQPMLLSYLMRRAPAVTATFASFRLQPTGLSPQYQTVRAIEKNGVELFSNLDAEALADLQQAFAAQESERERVPAPRRGGKQPVTAG